MSALAKLHRSVPVRSEVPLSAPCEGCWFRPTPDLLGLRIESLLPAAGSTGRRRISDERLRTLQQQLFLLGVRNC